MGGNGLKITNQQMKALLYKIASLVGIRADLLLHFGCCFIPSLFGYYGAAFALVLGIGKEYGDSRAKNNKWDWLDILADYMGLFIGYVIVFMIKWIINVSNL